MKRRLATASLLAALVTTPLAPHAAADTPRCVSRHEFARIAVGMSMTKVHQIFDTEGSSTHLGAPNKLRYYDTCSGRGAVQVVFTQKDRVKSKAARFF